MPEELTAKSAAGEAHDTQDVQDVVAEGHSSASDEDRSPNFEVVFDASNPYRRKSSMVGSEATLPRLRHVGGAGPEAKAQCIVHHFIDAQRRGQSAARDRHHQHQHQKHDRAAHQSQQVPAAVAAASPALSAVADESVDVERGLNGLVECKGRLQQSLQRERRRTIVDGGASDSDVGQVDEKAWRDGIVQTGSTSTTPIPTPQLPATPTSIPAMTAARAERPSEDGDDGNDSNDNGDDEEHMHSRLLTKRQLSDMAWGVRELSRRLGSLRLRFQAKNIFVLTKIYDEDLLPKTRELTRWLLSPEREVRYAVYVERSLRTSRQFDAAGLLDELRKAYAAAGIAGGSGDELTRRLRWWDESICRTRPHTFDFVITLGGDGTVLYASWLFQRIVPPVLSFALGSLGFLTKFDFDDYQSTLTMAFLHGVTVGLRLRFEATVMRSQPRRQLRIGEHDNIDAAWPRRDLVEELIGEEKDDEHTHRPDGTFEILNEVVVDRGPNASEKALSDLTMSFTEIFGDDEHFTSVLADGICVSTPTGSTAYNLAAGGSLCHPENPVMLVTAICAHSLSFRPIILPDTIVLRVGVPYSARTSSWASFDGRERIELQPGDYVTISASRFPFASVQARGRRSEEWVNSISGKLGWNTRQKQKAYKEWDKN